jgi:tRNA U34 5-carboxymethylaminomethyl modifying GTPase MnmE/TrmE
MTSNEHIELKKELDEFKNQIAKQGVIITKIHQAIVGDKEFGQDGLVNLVMKHERWIESQKFIWAKIYGGIAVGSAIISLALKYLL